MTNNIHRPSDAATYACWKEKTMIDDGARQVLVRAYIDYAEKFGHWLACRDVAVDGATDSWLVPYSPFESDGYARLRRIAHECLATDSWPYREAMTSKDITKALEAFYSAYTATWEAQQKTA